MPLPAPSVRNSRAWREAVEEFAGEDDDVPMAAGEEVRYEEEDSSSSSSSSDDDDEGEKRISNRGAATKQREKEKEVAKEEEEWDGIDGDWDDADDSESEGDWEDMEDAGDTEEDEEEAYDHPPIEETLPPQTSPLRRSVRQASNSQADAAGSDQASNRVNTGLPLGPASPLLEEHLPPLAAQRSGVVLETQGSPVPDALPYVPAALQPEAEEAAAIPPPQSEPGPPPISSLGPSARRISLSVPPFSCFSSRESPGPQLPEGTLPSAHASADSVSGPPSVRASEATAPVTISDPNAHGNTPIEEDDFDDEPVDERPMQAFLALKQEHVEERLRLWSNSPAPDDGRPWYERKDADGDFIPPRSWFEAGMPDPESAIVKDAGLQHVVEWTLILQEEGKFTERDIRFLSYVMQAGAATNVYPKGWVRFVFFLLRCCSSPYRRRPAQAYGRML
jgi:hypothetical protein